MMSPHVVLTQDEDAAKHRSFASGRPGVRPYQSIDTFYGTQILWPDHCVQATHGAAFHQGRPHRGMARGGVVPYRTNDDLPPALHRLPPHAQDIYREAFNHAYAAHNGDPRQEEAAHRIAWAAVKQLYQKQGDVWVAK